MTLLRCGAPNVYIKFNELFSINLTQKVLPSALKEKIHFVLITKLDLYHLIRTDLNVMFLDKKISIILFLAC